MKKVFAILVIMVILVGAVFAEPAGTATLTITSEVTKRFPGFQLVGADQATGGASATASLRIRGNNVEDETTHETTWTAAAASTDMTTHGDYDSGNNTIAAVNSISEQDIVVNFTLKQSGSEGYDSTSSKYYARNTHVYNFGVVVGNMTKLGNNGQPVANPSANQTVVAKDATSTTDSPVDVKFTKGSVTTGNEIELKDSTDSIGADYRFVAVYKGTVYDDQTIGTFNVKWLHNADLEEGSYEATVTVTVSLE